MCNHAHPRRIPFQMHKDGQLETKHLKFDKEIYTAYPNRLSDAYYFGACIVFECVRFSIAKIMCGWKSPSAAVSVAIWSSSTLEDCFLVANTFWRILSPFSSDVAQCRMLNEIWNASLTHENFIEYVSNRSDARTTWRTCWVPSSRGVGEEAMRYNDFFNGIFDASSCAILSDINIMMPSVSRIVLSTNQVRMFFMATIVVSASHLTNQKKPRQRKQPWRCGLLSFFVKMTQYLEWERRREMIEGKCISDTEDTRK